MPAAAAETSLNLEILQLQCSNDLINTGTTIERSIHPEICQKILDQTSQTSGAVTVSVLGEREIIVTPDKTSPVLQEQIAQVPEQQNIIMAVAEVLGVTDLDTTERKILTFATIPIGFIGFTLFSNDYFSRNFRNFVRRGRR